MKKAASCLLSDRTTVEYAYKFIERSGGLSHKHSQEYWCFSTKAELCGSVEGGERFLQGIKDVLKEDGEVSVRFLPGSRTWNKKLAAKLIADAKQGDADADQVLREVAAEFLKKRIPLQDELADLADYVAAYLQQTNSSKKQSHKTEYRDWILALTIHKVAWRFNLTHTRNEATEEHCACSIVELATGLHNNIVQTAWHDYQGVADQRTNADQQTNYVGQAVVSVTYDGPQRHLLERFPRVISDDGTQEHFLVHFPRVGSAKVMSRPSSRKAQRAKRAKAQRAKRPEPIAARRPGRSRKLDAMTSRRRIESIKPDQQDFDSVEKEYGPLPGPNPSQAALAERYRLAQAAKVIRQLEQVAIGGKTKNRKSKQ